MVIAIRHALPSLRLHRNEMKAIIAAETAERVLANQLPNPFKIKAPKTQELDQVHRLCNDQILQAQAIRPQFHDPKQLELRQNVALVALQEAQAEHGNMN